MSYALCVCLVLLCGLVVAERRERSERSEANNRVLFEIPRYLYIYIYIYIYICLSASALCKSVCLSVTYRNRPNCVAVQHSAKWPPIYTSSGDDEPPPATWPQLQAGRRAESLQRAHLRDQGAGAH